MRGTEDYKRKFRHRSIKIFWLLEFWRTIVPYDMEATELIRKYRRLTNVGASKPRAALEMVRT
jgi:hypothetical protein